MNEPSHDLPEQAKRPMKGKTQQDTRKGKAEPAGPADEQLAEITDEHQAPETQPEPGLSEQTLEQTQEEMEKFRDLALRAEAEMQNLRKRTQRDVENAHKYGLERFLNNLLPVADSLEKAIDAAGGEADDDPIAEGVRLCHKLLMDVIAKENVEVIDPAGEPFDPNEHQAISMIEHHEMEPNSVVTVVQKGYKLNSRLVRPATVLVSKTPDPQTPANDADSN